MARGGTAARAGRGAVRASRWTGRLLRGHVVSLAGGPARARVIVLFGCVLGLNSADTATVGAVAPQLEHALSIGNTKIGLLSSVSLLVGALFVLPVGLLVDRAKRMPMLSFSILLWSAASLAAGLAGDYSSLLLSRLALGAVAATAGPAIASLTGDYFPSRERGHVYAYILGGEIGGTAVGFILGGALASLISWRAAFVALAIPGVFLARSLWRTVPEPRRGGQSRLQPGAATFAEALGEVDGRDGPAGPPEHEPAREAVRRHGIRPDRRLILLRDPRRLSFGQSIRYILSIPTNVLLIISSALGYFFFSGLQTFAIVFVRGQYHVSQGTATLVLAMLVLGALVGTLVSGRLSDLMLRRGVLEARVLLPTICYTGAAALLVPGVLGTNLTPALWFDVGGTALLCAANPPLDAARLDIMPSGLWGRAESTRTFLRSLAQAVAPLAFGGLADVIAGIAPQQAPVGTHTGAIDPNSTLGLRFSFLIMLVTLAASAVFLGRSLRTYPRDVATAEASERRDASAGSPAAPRAPAGRASAP